MGIWLKRILMPVLHALLRGDFREAGDSVPLKVTFTGGKFFPGLERKNKVIGMIKAHVC